MLKRKLDDTDTFIPKKSRLIKKIDKILDFNPSHQTWLIEWVDRTRSWATYKELKDHEEFEKMIVRLSFRSAVPEYIG